MRQNCNTVMKHSLDDSGLPQALADSSVGRSPNFLRMAKSVSVAQANRQTGGLTRCSVAIGRGRVAEEVLKLLRVPEAEFGESDWNVIAKRAKLQFPIPKKVGKLEHMELELCRKAHNKFGTETPVDKNSIHAMHRHAELLVEPNVTLGDDEKDYLAANHARSVIGQILSNAAEDMQLVTVGHTRTATNEEMEKVQRVERVLQKAFRLIEQVLDASEITAADTIVDIAQETEAALRTLFMHFNIAPIVGYKLPQTRRRQGSIVNSSEKVGRNAPCPCGSGCKFKRCCGGPNN